MYELYLFTRLPNGNLLTWQEMLHWDEVTKDKPEHHVLTVEADQGLEQGESNNAKLKNNQCQF